MLKYIKEFANHTAYQSAESNLDKPNVSLCVQEDEVHYNPWVETRIIAKYNITNTESSTKIINVTRNIGVIEIDGIQQSNVSTSYQFSTTGEHIIKFSMNENDMFKNEIYQNQFNGCKELTNIVIPINITKIDSYAFRQCTNLTTVILPESLTKIDTYAFDNCTSLTSIILPDNITNIGEYAFNYCSGLTNVSIPNKVTYINQYTFNHCSNLTSIIIPNSVKNIGYSAFQSCTGLISITIPDSVTYLFSGCFYKCSNLTSITVEKLTPPTLQSTSFDYTNNCPIYVPSESVETYKSASVWSDYASRIQAIPTT